jgi:hypothetical protein
MLVQLSPKYLFLSPVASDLDLPLLSIFHHLSMKCLKRIGTYEVKLQGHRKIERFDLAAFMLNVSLMITQ